MPLAALSYCSARGCNTLVHGGRCAMHARPAWQDRDTRPSMGKGWSTTRARILKRDPTCALCGIWPSTEVDHILSRSRGGGDGDHNLRGACSSCHRRRSARQGAEARR